MIRDLQELKELTADKHISFIRIKEKDDALQCEAFSETGYVGDCLLLNKQVINKLKHHAVLNKVKGAELNAIMKDIARLHLKIKSGRTEQI